MYKYSLVYSMKTVGANNPKEFAKYKAFFEKLKNDVELKDCAIAALDDIAGRRYKYISNNVVLANAYLFLVCFINSLKVIIILGRY